MNIGKRIKLYLVENDVSQKELSAMTGIPDTKLNLSLNGKRILQYEELELILGALDENPSKFIFPKKILESTDRSDN